MPPHFYRMSEQSQSTLYLSFQRPNLQMVCLAHLSSQSYEDSPQLSNPFQYRKHKSDNQGISQSIPLYLEKPYFRLDLIHAGAQSFRLADYTLHWNRLNIPPSTLHVRVLRPQNLTEQAGSEYQPASLPFHLNRYETIRALAFR